MKKVTVTAYVPPNVGSWLRQKAVAEHRKISAVVEMILRSAMATDKGNVTRGT